MKRYLLFVGDHYEAQGWDELFQDDFDTIEEAQEAVSRPELSGTDWFEIVDTGIKRTIKAGTVYRWLKKE
jgi:hypothetical protein